MIGFSSKKISFVANILIVYEHRLVCCPISSPSVHAQMPPPSLLHSLATSSITQLARALQMQRGLCNKMASASSAVKKPNSKAYLSVMVLYGCGRVALPPQLFICRPASELCRLDPANWFKVDILSAI